MPGAAWLSYFLVPLLLLALLGSVLLGATLLSWQHAPARNKIPRAQKRREVAMQKMEALAQRLRQQEPELDPKPILELPLEKLAQKLWADELRLESVLCSYLEEALKVHHEMNCLTDFLGECEEQLQALKKLKKSERGLLYAVPISLKDNFDCMGHDSTCGLAQFLEKPAAQDGVIVKVLKAHGAIPFVKTNISRHCSGAELGSGWVGFCSSSGVTSAVKGKKSVTTAAGPMARDVESLALCLRALLSEDMHQLDPTVPPPPFREEVYSSKWPLRIGYYESDGFTQPSPSMARAVRLTSRLLQDAGHQVIPFSVPRVEYAFIHLFTGGLYADGGATLLEKLKGDIVDPSMKGLVSLLRLPDPLKCFWAWILKYIDPRTSQNLEEIRGVGTPKKLWEQHTAVEEYQQEFIAKWSSLDLDVLLVPALDPAFYIGYPALAASSFSYVSLFNVLNFSAGVVPVTTVTLEDEEELAFYRGYSGDSFDKNFREVVRGSVGLPVGVQCVALAWEEELCLRLMKEVETLVKNQREPK